MEAGEWSAFAQLVLEAAYEATLLAAVCDVVHGGSNVVLLTLLGGGAFGNERTWIFAAITRAVEIVADAGLDIRLVSYSASDKDLTDFAAELEGGRR